jgi:predicted nucleotidyltransferase
MKMGDKLSLEAVRNFLYESKERIREKFGVRKIGIFGSYVRGNEKATSDIDILIEFEEDKVTFKNYMGLKFFLEDSFNRKVDLVIIEDLKPLLKESILRKAVYV